MRGAWRARVTRIKDGRPHVVIPRLSGELEYGPLEKLEGIYTLEGLATEDALGSPNTHGHLLFAGASRALKADDRVLVVFLEGRIDDPVILGRLG